MAEKKMSLRKIKNHYAKLVHGLKEDGHIKIGKDVFNVTPLYLRHNERVEARLPTSVKLTNHFEWVARKIAVASALKERLEKRRFKLLRRKWENVAIDNLENIHGELRTGALKHAEELIETARGFIAREENSVARAQASIVTYSRPELDEIIKVVTKHKRIIEKL